jgi:sec-independent protein translocase protein TatB
MFGMGFMEILLIAIIAVVALGPDKLPGAMVEVAKFIKKFKSGVDDAKTTLNNELNIDDLKNEANNFKAQLEDTKTSLSESSKLDLGLDGVLNEDLDPRNVFNSTKEDDKEKVSFKKEEATIEVAQIDESTKDKVESDNKKGDNV